MKYKATFCCDATRDMYAYVNQTGNGMPVFAGDRYQRSAGSMISSLVRRIVVLFVRTIASNVIKRPQTISTKNSVIRLRNL